MRNRKSFYLLPKMVLNLSCEKLAPSYMLQITIDIGNVQALIARDAFELETYYRRVLNLNSDDYTTIPREASCHHSQPASLDTSKFLSRLKTATTSKQCKKNTFSNLQAKLAFQQTDEIRRDMINSINSTHK